MSVKIRLHRQGAKKNPQYLIVATDKDKKRDGEYLARLGFYFPKAKLAKDKVKVDMAKVKQWQAKGAVFSETVGQLLKTLAE